MYVKIVDQHGHGERIIETREVSHRSIKVEDPTRFDVAEHGLDGVHSVEFFGAMWGSKACTVSAVVLTVPIGDNGCRAIVTLGCGIYIMGDDGKTVDVIRY